MTEQNRAELIRDILDKARGFCNTKEKIIILTAPSARYPRGGKFEGYIFDVYEDKIIKLDDTYASERINIFISEIKSPSDIFPKEVRDGSLID